MTANNQECRYMERSHYSDVRKRLLYTKFERKKGSWKIPYKIVGAVSVVSGRIKSSPHFAGKEQPATFSVKAGMPSKGTVVPVLSHNMEAYGGVQV
jgi:hypothetical protein